MLPLRYPRWRMANEDHGRGERRNPSPRLEVVTIYRVPASGPARSPGAALHGMFTVVALVHDASEHGLGLEFEGQHIMADNLLRPGDRYLLKMTFSHQELEDAAAHPFLHPEGESYASLHLEATCRWFQPGAVSKVGFVVSPDEDPAVLAFVRERLSH